MSLSTSLKTDFVLKAERKKEQTLWHKTHYLDEVQLLIKENDSQNFAV